MLSSTAVPILMFGTLGAVLVVAAFVLIRFMRKPKNRHPMEHQKERNIEEIRTGKEPEQM